MSLSPNDSESDQSSVKQPLIHPHHAIKSLDSIAEEKCEGDTTMNSPRIPLSSTILSMDSVVANGSDSITQPLAISSSFSSISDGNVIPVFAPTLSMPGTKSESGESWLLRQSCVGSGPFEDPVQGTTDDASISKLSAVSTDYYEDPYLQYIVKHPNRRSPLINRGYFSRVAAIRKTIATFLDSIPSTIKQVQIVNLGAGLDTTYFWIQDFWVKPEVIVYEIDFLEVISKKVLLFTRKEQLWERLGLIPHRQSIQSILQHLHEEKPIMMNQTLHLVPIDIRSCINLEDSLQIAGFQSNLPTLFISECALIYIQATYSDALIQWASRFVTAPSAFVLYEQINPHDAFGKTMIKNLEYRGCPLLGIHDYPGLEDQKKRFLERGWDRVTGADMNTIYNKFFDKYEICRIQNLELFDEMEEWRLIQEHYFVLIAVQKGIGYVLPDGPLEYSSDEVQKEMSQEDPVCFLDGLSKLWDSNNQTTEELPRFTTKQYKEHPIIGGWMDRYFDNVKPEPGRLSVLMRPEATANLKLDLNGNKFGDTRFLFDSQNGTCPTRKWSVPINSEEK